MPRVIVVVFLSAIGCGATATSRSCAIAAGLRLRALLAVEGMVYTWPLTPLICRPSPAPESFPPPSPVLHHSKHLKSPKLFRIRIRYLSKMSDLSQYCDVCQCEVPGGGWDTHASGRSHCRNAGARTEAALQSAQRDRNGVSIPTQDAELDFGVVEPKAASKVVKSFTLKVKTETAEFMVLDPHWISSALRETACVILAWCHTSPNKLTLPAASHVLSKVTLISREVTRFALSWACESPESVVTKTRWR
jgi:hypothetical protein